MHRPKTGYKHAVIGKEVLGVLALLLVASELSVATAVPVLLGNSLLAATEAYVPSLAGPAADAVVLAALYLQAVVVAGVYRAIRGTYRLLQHRVATATAA